MWFSTVMSWPRFTYLSPVSELGNERNSQYKMNTNEAHVTLLHL